MNANFIFNSAHITDSQSQWCFETATSQIIVDQFFESSRKAFWIQESPSECLFFRIEVWSEFFKLKISEKFEFQLQKGDYSGMVAHIARLNSEKHTEIWSELKQKFDVWILSIPPPTVCEVRFHHHHRKSVCSGTAIILFRNLFFPWCVRCALRCMCVSTCHFM